ncbi:hypothetical protein COE92_21435 [Bacillus wiedmannii]|uniref:restriction endonuclease subunit M n=1 Tax=Bacillus wiedmannii TaxID=1890302 RepID=UPI000BFE4EA4|nr:N-6 DNA methylase [Bacillus wiedmannii]PHB51644.1 hypothetical protein COE92_21435 [Bacillus wiedmannii]
MDKAFKDRILDYINKKDPENEIVKIDEVNKKITYNEKIVCHNGVKFENEGYIRAYLIVKLVKELNYPIECIELEKHFNIGSRPVDKSAFLDILVKRKNDTSKTFFFIECKSPEEYDLRKANIETQLFNMASIQDSQVGEVKYLVYYTVDELLEDRNIIIDFTKSKSYKTWLAQSSQDELNVLPLDYETSYYAHYAKVSETEANQKKLKPLNNELDRDGFWKLKDKIHNVLWGGGSSSYNDVFYYLMHLFLAKIYDELWSKENEVYKFQIFYEDGVKEDQNKTFTRVESLYRAAQSHLLNQPQDIIERSTFIDLDKVSLSKVIGSVKLLQSISLTENKNESDILGEFFESIISTQFKQDKGQFFTDTNIVKFIIEALDIKEEAIKRLNQEDEEEGLLPYIIDPSCGSGTFLLEAMKIISNYYRVNKHEVNVSRPIKAIIEHQLFIQDEDDKNKMNTWANQFIYGIEPNIELATASKVNMILHGDGNANIFINDGLAHFSEYNQPARITKQRINRLQEESKENIFGIEYPLNEQFDYILSNPPFSLTFAEDEDQKSYADRFGYANKKNSENLFIERWYQLLKENGKIGAVLPDSIFDTTENKYIRLFLFKYFKVNAVISLDKIAFQPYTSTKVSILFAAKKTKQEVKSFEEKWDTYTKKYLELRNTNLIKLILQNDDYYFGKSGLIKLCEKYNIDFEVTQKVLDLTVLNDTLYFDLFKKIVPEELCLELENIEEKIEILKQDKHVYDYQMITEIAVKERTADHKKKLKELKTKQEVKEYIELEKKYKPIAKKVYDNADMKKLDRIRKFVSEGSLASYSEVEGKEILTKFLKEYYPSNLEILLEIIERAYEEILEISKQDYPDWETTKAEQHQSGYGNSWWVYGEVSKELNYEMFYAEAINLGYKRTKRGRQERLNELYNVSKSGEIVVDKTNPKTILDMLKAERIWQ